MLMFLGLVAVVACVILSNKKGERFDAVVNTLSMGWILSCFFDSFTD